MLTYRNTKNEVQIIPDQSDENQAIYSTDHMRHLLQLLDMEYIKMYPDGEASSVRDPLK